MSTAHFSPTPTQDTERDDRRESKNTNTGSLITMTVNTMANYGSYPAFIHNFDQHIYEIWLVNGRGFPPFHFKSYFFLRKTQLYPNVNEMNE